MEDGDCSSNVIESNTYIIIQRLGYFKLHQLLDNSNVMLGKDKVLLKNVIGKRYWTMFKMVPIKSKNREFDLEMCSEADSSSEDILKAVNYGVDNRNVTDDGKSQLLSSNDITCMRESGLTGQKILEKIVENSTTFKDKTEYSQEKYLKKKGKKYCEFIVIRPPTLRLLSDIFYSRDQAKVMGLRHDTLSQIFTSVNLQHDGVYALFENGSQALVGAGILNYLSSEGLLINLTLGTTPQKQAILAMNFKKEQLAQLVSVKIKELLKFLGDASEDNGVLPGKSTGEEMCDTKEKQSEDYINGFSREEDTSQISSGDSSELVSNVSNESEIQSKCEGESNETDKSGVKRKLMNDDAQNSKKPKWAEDLEKGSYAFKNKGLNGIIIVAKEYPLNIVTKLLPFLKPSCQLVIYSVFREPLVQLYLELKRRKDVIGLHLTENWLRMYQVLPDRTHPDVTMTFTGHLLTGTKVL